jgi:hypothetical protein
MERGKKRFGYEMYGLGMLDFSCWLLGVFFQLFLDRNNLKRPIKMVLFIAFVR